MQLCIEGKSSLPQAPNKSSETYRKKIVEETRNQNHGSDDQRISGSVEGKSDVPLQEQIHNPLQNTNSSPSIENHSSKKPFIALTLKMFKYPGNDSLKEPTLAFQLNN